MRVSPKAGLALLGALFFLAHDAAVAQVSDDPMWTKAKQAIAESRNLVVDELVTEMEMIDGDGASMGSMTIQEKISGWDHGEPLRTIVSNTNPEYVELAKARFKVMVDDHPEKSLLDESGLERMATTMLDGKTCRVFVATGKKDKILFNSKVWIDESSGLPLKVVHEFSGIPMTKSLENSITFGKNSAGAWVPVSAVVDATVSMLFKKLRIISKYRFVSWIKRP